MEQIWVEIQMKKRKKNLMNLWMGWNIYLYQKETFVLHSRFSDNKRLTSLKIHVYIFQ